MYVRKLKSVSMMVEQAVVLCQVEKAKEDMLNQLYSSVRLSTLLYVFLCVHETLPGLALQVAVKRVLFFYGLWICIICHELKYHVFLVVFYTEIFNEYIMFWTV